MTPTEQTCPKCGTRFIGSDVIGEPCWDCRYPSESVITRQRRETLRAYERLPLAKRQEHAKTMGWPIPQQ